MKIKRVGFFSNHTHESALEHLRIHSPLKNAGLTVLRGVEAGQFSQVSLDSSDLVLFQRDLPQDLPLYQYIRDYAREHKKPLVFDLDDLIFMLPESHPDRKSGVFVPSNLPVLQAMMEADLVTVTTKTLKEQVSKYTSKVAILPNYFDDCVWSLQQPVMKKNERSPVVIGYMGGESHKPDLVGITPVLVELLQQYSDRIEFRFWGIKPPEDIAFYSQVKWIPSVTYDYQGFSKFFQTQKADIFLAPLADNIFNRCKSGLKFFEYSALGIPGVFSDLDPYNDIITHGEQGLLAVSEDDWIENISSLIEDETLRYSLAVKAQSEIRENYLLSKNAYRWTEAYNALENRELKFESIKGELSIELTKSLSSQFYEYKLNQDNLISDLHSQIVLLNEDVAQKESDRHYKQLLIDQLESEIKDINDTPTRKIVIKIDRLKRVLTQPGSTLRILSKVVLGLNHLGMGNINNDLELRSNLKLIRKSSLFNAEWYLQHYPEVSDGAVDPAMHYLNVGAQQGYDPSERFSTSKYLENNPDVKKLGVNPLVHYINYGMYERRKTLAEKNANISVAKVDRMSVQLGEERKFSPNSIHVKVSLRSRLKRLYHKLPIPVTARQRISQVKRRIAPGIEAFHNKDTRTTQTYDNYRLPWRQVALKRCLANIVDQVPCGRKISHIISLPFLSTGGAELVAMNFAKAIIRAERDCVLLITDNAGQQVAQETLSGIIHLSISDYLPGRDSNDKKLLVHDLLITLKPKIVHNINSDIMWKVFVEDGDRLKAYSKLFASIFAMQFDDRGSRLGYAEYYLKDSINHLSGLIADNRRFFSDAIAAYCLQDQSNKFRTVYTPSRAISETSIITAHNRLQEYSARISQSDKLSCVWAGRMDKEKRWDLFIEVAKKCQLANFDMYGQAVVDSEFMLPNFNNIRYRGKFTSTEELFFENKYDAFVFTSKWEGLPNILIEAGTWGVPIIAPNVGGVAELIDSETGYLLPEKPMAQDYLNALQMIRSDPSEAVRRASNLLDLILKRHNWESFINDVRSIPRYLSESS